MHATIRRAPVQVATFAARATANTHAREFRVYEHFATSASAFSVRWQDADPYATPHRVEFQHLQPALQYAAGLVQRTLSGEEI